MNKIKYEVSLNIDIVPNYKGTNDTYLFISTLSGSGAKYKVNSIQEVKEKINFYIDNYVCEDGSYG